MADDHGQTLALGRGLALHIDELRGVRHGIENDHELRWKLEREERPLTRAKLDHLKDDLRHALLKIVRKISPRTPENLAVILEGRQPVRIMGGDPADPWAHREGHL